MIKKIVVTLLLLTAKGAIALAILCIEGIKNGKRYYD